MDGFKLDSHDAPFFEMFYFGKVVGHCPTGIRNHLEFAVALEEESRVGDIFTIYNVVYFIGIVDGFLVEFH
jgi:hypothetical protein